MELVDWNLKLESQKAHYLERIAIHIDLHDRESYHWDWLRMSSS